MSVPSKREPMWVYVALILVTGLWAFFVALVCSFFFPWNVYIVWAIAWGIADLAVVYKIARRRR